MNYDHLFDDELQATAYDLSNLIDMTENAQERAQYRAALRTIETHGN